MKQVKRLFAAAVVAVTVAGGCVADDAGQPEATVDVGRAQSALTGSLALSQLPGIYGLGTTQCAAGEHIAVVVAYRQTGAVADLAMATGATANRFNQLGGTSPQAPTEPVSSGNVWKRLTRSVTQPASAMAKGCVVDIYEANSPSQADLGTAADTARNATPTPRAVINAWGFDESTVGASFKLKFAPKSNQAIVAMAGKVGSSFFAPAIYGTTISVGEHDLNASFAPIGMTGALAGFSLTEARPTFQPATFTSRRLPDIAGYAGQVDIVEDGLTVQASGLSLATAIQGGNAALVASPANAHLWTATSGIVDITTGPGAAPGVDDYGLGTTTGTLAF